MGIPREVKINNNIKQLPVQPRNLGNDVMHAGVGIGGLGAVVASTYLLTPSLSSKRISPETKGVHVGMSLGVDAVGASLVWMSLDNFFSKPGNLKLDKNQLILLSSGVMAFGGGMAADAGMNEWNPSGKLAKGGFGLLLFGVGGASIMTLVLQKDSSVNPKSGPVTVEKVDVGTTDGKDRLLQVSGRF